VSGNWARSTACPIGRKWCTSTTELDDVRDWLQRRDGPMVLDAKIDPDIVAEWLEEAFR
jgi:hypothetical protein